MSEQHDDRRFAELLAEALRMARGTGHQDFPLGRILVEDEPFTGRPDLGPAVHVWLDERLADGSLPSYLVSFRRVDPDYLSREYLEATQQKETQND
jgi:hypothetical protein